MKINGYYNYYISPDPARNKELFFCFNALMKNPEIDRMFIVAVPDSLDKLVKLYIRNSFKKKAYFVPMTYQPTFKEIIEILNKNTADDDINFFINSDCYIDKQNIKLVRQHIKSFEVWCMTRWEILSLCPFETEHYGNPLSQDLWIKVGRFPNIKDGNYKMGMPGCDNALAYEFAQAGMILKNPSLDVRHYHLHKSDTRTYNDLSFYKNLKKFNKYRVVKPFQEVNFTEL